MSSTKNVKLGVCRVYFDGDDLGLTQGGVEVAVSTESHKVTVDQFGKTPINEYIMGRTLTVKCPLAETTIENMVKIMPGAVLTSVGGVAAFGTYTLSATAPIANETVVINGVTFTFKVAPVGQLQVKTEATSALAAANLLAKLNACTTPAVSLADYTLLGLAITATYEAQGVAGNAFTLAVGTSTGTVSGATLANGVEATSKYVEVDHGVGQDLLATAKELRLHPTAKAANDFSDDFVIGLANTPGALNFAYKLDAERIFNVEFSGYPDPTTGKLFYVGDKG